MRGGKGEKVYKRLLKRNGYHSNLHFRVTSGYPTCYVSIHQKKSLKKLVLPVKTKEMLKMGLIARQFYTSKQFSEVIEILRT